MSKEDTIKVLTCPQCGGEGKIPILDSAEFDRTGIVKWLDKKCPMCKGQKLIRVNTDKLKEK